MAQVPINTTFLVSVWLEALIYGFQFSVFCAALYVNYGQLKRSEAQVMFTFGTIMFVLSTWHLVINLYRLIQGFIVHGTTPEGPVAYFSDLAKWSNVMKDIIYAVQEMLGSAAAIFRCWMVWNKDFRIIALPSALLIAMIISGLTTCALFAKVDSTFSVFNVRLNHWITAFYSFVLASNIITTSLIAWPLWQAEKEVKNLRIVRLGGGLLPVLRVLVESAALQLFAEIFPFVLYVDDSIALAIVLESVTPIISITFNVISVRLRYRTPTRSPSEDTLPIQNRPVHTIGSIPMRRLNVNVEMPVEESPRSPFSKRAAYKPVE